EAAHEPRAQPVDAHPGAKVVEGPERLSRQFPELVGAVGLGQSRRMAGGAADAVETDDQLLPAGRQYPQQTERDSVEVFFLLDGTERGRSGHGVPFAVRGVRASGEARRQPRLSTGWGFDVTFE